MKKKFSWTGRLHFCGDVINTEAWFEKSNEPEDKPLLDFIFCPDKLLKEVRKLNRKIVKITLDEVK